MASRRVRWHPTLAVVLIVLLLLGAVPPGPPAEATGGDPFQLNVMELSFLDPEEAVRVPADVPFFVQHANAFADGCVEGEPTPQALDSATGFVLLLDDVELDGELVVWCEVEDDGAETFIRGSRYDLVEGLAAGSYELQGVWTDGDGQTGLEVSLPIEVAPAAIRGRVTDRESGAPISGATLWSAAGPVTSWRDGSYAIFDLDPGEHTLVVEAEQRTDYQGAAVGPVTYDGQTMVTLDIELIPLTVAPDVLGTVTDAASGTPIVGAEVSLFWEDGGARIPSVPTDLEGRYGFRGVDPDRTFRLRVIGPWQMDHFPGWDAAVLISELLSFAGAAPLVVDLEVPPVPSFLDVPGDNVHAPGILAIAAAGITLGLPDGRFDPAGTVTRGQMASFLARALQLPADASFTFPDVPADATHAAGISAIAAAGITLGLPDGRFDPAGTVTRGQMASFLARALELVALPPFDACLVTDGSSRRELGFTQLAYAGLLRARDDHGLNVIVVEPGVDEPIELILARLVTQDCGIIVAVGFGLAEAAATVAAANPAQRFAVHDDESDRGLPNLRELGFAPDEAAFVAGYLAAGMSESGTIGTFGGVPVPPVTAFMDGLLAGTRHYNAVHGTEVAVIGWDGSEGQFVGGFTDRQAGRLMAASLLADGADIILPVAGPAGAGTGAAIEAHGSGAMMWVDTDGYRALPAYRSLILTSVLKRIDLLVYETIVEAVVDDAFTAGPAIGTLENGGVGIAPLHEFADLVPGELQEELEDVTSAIINGELSVDPDDH